MLEDTLREAARGDEQTKERIIRELASQSDETAQALINHLQFGGKGGTERIAVRVLCEIGYPRNAAALPHLIYLVEDLNDPAWNEAAQTILEMGSEEVVPALIAVLLDWGKKVQYWEAAIEGICAMLSKEEANRE